MVYFPSGNIVLVPINQQIFKSWNFTKNKLILKKIPIETTNHGAAYCRKIYFRKHWFQGASSQTKPKMFKNNWKVKIKICFIEIFFTEINTHERGSKNFWHHFFVAIFDCGKLANFQIFKISRKTSQLIYMKLFRKRPL